jgi:hypothetical protein
MLRTAYHSVLRAMLKPVSSRIRRGLGFFAGLCDRADDQNLAADPNPTAATRPDGRNPLDFMHPETFATICSHIPNPHVMFQMQFARQVIARDRAAHLLGGNVAKARETDAVAHNAMRYNLEAAASAPELDRPMVLTNVVSSIERVQKNIADLDILSIGPRSEIELFGLIAAGFKQSRIRAIDLFSYSPLVEIGDMHAMPYADNSFDVIFLGWVLAYSKDQARAAREVLRVSRDRTIIAIAGDYSETSFSVFSNEETRMQSCQQVLDLFEGHVRRIYFQHDPELPDTAMVMTVFEVTKS